MPALPRRLLFFALVALTLPTAAAQTPEPGKATASLSGRVSVAGKPLSRVPVVVSQSGAPRINNSITAVAKTTTDEDGRFHLADLAPGKYVVTAVAPAFIVPKEAGNSWEEGRGVTLAEGDQVDDVELALKVGGVITGRITDANNQPLIETRVNLHQLDARGASRNFNIADYNRQLTDDRGVYRLYGLPAGRYKVSIGFPTSGMLRVGTASGIYQQTFYPGVREEARAEVVEVVEGAELTGIDMAAGLPVKTYTARGRIINAATGRPVPNSQFGYGTVSQGAQGDEMNSMGMTANRTDARGEFIQEGVLPGRYAMFAVVEENSDEYSDTVIFEVKDADVAGLEVRMRRGSSLSGVVVIDGASEAEARDLLSQLVINYSMSPRGLMAWRPAPLKAAPDGTFKIGGLRAGKVQIGPQPVKNLSLMSVDHNGADAWEGIDVKEGEAVTGVKLVLAYSTGVVRGQVTFAEGAKVEGARYGVALRLPGGDGRFSRSGDLDSGGRFLLEGVPAGEYELMLVLNPAFGVPPTPALNTTTQKVAVEKGAAAQVNFIVKASADGREK